MRPSEQDQDQLCGGIHLALPLDDDPAAIELEWVRDRRPVADPLQAVRDVGS